MFPPNPFFLWDESLSRNVVPEITAATGYPIATIWDEWPGRDLSVNPLLDDEIIRHLGHKGGHLAFWITQDWNAMSEYKLLLDAHRISVLWLRGPGGRSFRPPEQSMLTIAVIDTAHHLAAAHNAPVYLRARMAPGDAPRPILERLAGSLTERPRRWQTVRLIQ